MEPNTEINQSSPSSQSNLFELYIDHESTAHLSETARWAKFLAIVGFVFIGIEVIFGVFVGSFFGALTRSMGGGVALPLAGGGFLSFFYIIIGLLYFLPCLYLFNFATKMQVALRSNDQQNLAQSFRNLKACYRFIGILMIIMLAFMVLGFFFAMIGFAFMSR